MYYATSYHNDFSSSVAFKYSVNINTYSKAVLALTYKKKFQENCKTYLFGAI